MRRAAFLLLALLPFCAAAAAGEPPAAERLLGEWCVLPPAAGAAPAFLTLVFNADGTLRAEEAVDRWASYPYRVEGDRLIIGEPGSGGQEAVFSFAGEFLVLAPAGGGLTLQFERPPPPAAGAPDPRLAGRWTVLPDRGAGEAVFEAVVFRPDGTGETEQGAQRKAFTYETRGDTLRLGEPEGGREEVLGFRFEGETLVLLLPGDEDTPPLYLARAPAAPAPASPAPVSPTPAPSASAAPTGGPASASPSASPAAGEPPLPGSWVVVRCSRPGEPPFAGLLLLEDGTGQMLGGGPGVVSFRYERRGQRLLIREAEGRELELFLSFAGEVLVLASAARIEDGVALYLERAPFELSPLPTPGATAAASASASPTSGPVPDQLAGEWVVYAHEGPTPPTFDALVLRADRTGEAEQSRGGEVARAPVAFRIQGDLIYLGPAGETWREPLRFSFAGPRLRLTHENSGTAAVLLRRESLVAEARRARELGAQAAKLAEQNRWRLEFLRLKRLMSPEQLRELEGE